MHNVHNICTYSGVKQRLTFNLMHSKPSSSPESYLALGCHQENKL